MSLPIFTFDKEDIDKHSNTHVDLDQLLVEYAHDQQKHDYLTAIRKNLSSILVGTLDELQRTKKVLQSILNLETQPCAKKKGKKDCAVCINCARNESNREFSAKIQTAFGYAPNRIYPYFIKQNNRACYICNAQYTLFAYKNYKINTKLAKMLGQTYQSKPGKSFILQKKTVAKFQFDHYYPKSEFPAFSLSLHNLIPVCSYCNQVKSSKQYFFEDLHTRLTYGVEEKSIIDYFNNDGPLKVTLNDETRENIGTAFSLKGIYDNHTDIVEDVLHRKIKYTPSYKQALELKFPEVIIDKDLIEERLILGIYAKSDGFHKRPLSKFIHDINDQLEGLAL